MTLLGKVMIGGTCIELRPLTTLVCLFINTRVFLLLISSLFIKVLFHLYNFTSITRHNKSLSVDLPETTRLDLARYSSSIYMPTRTEVAKT